MNIENKKIVITGSTGFLGKHLVERFINCDVMEIKRDLSGLNAQWSVGDFMIHFPGIKNSKRIELVKYYMTKIIK